MSVGRSVSRSVGRLHLFLIANFAVSRLAETHYCPCPTARDRDSLVLNLTKQVLMKMLPNMYGYIDRIIRKLINLANADFSLI